MNWTVAKLIEATGGELLQGNVEVELSGISTDTRSLKAGDCFVALAGENHDGHDFIPDALGKKASAVLLTTYGMTVGFPREVAVVKVADTLFALGELARYHRKRYSIPVVGITGSNGKTSTKEMIAAILGVDRSVHKNAGNLNNLIGVPLTLLSLRPDHETAVIEMGINVFGEMQRLLEITQPTVGLITNIHPAHLEGLESPERILEEKGSLLTSLSADGLAVINLDDERLRSLSKTLKARVLTYSSRDAGADVHLRGSVAIDQGVSTFSIALGPEAFPVHLSVLGLHQVQNALAAASVGYAMGAPPESIIAGLERHRPVPQRMEVCRLKEGTILVNDTYNANPVSMLAAVRATLEASNGKPVIAILGEMREMGPEGARLHREVGREIGAMGPAQLITLGDLAAEIGKGALEAGMSQGTCFHASSHRQIVTLLRSLGVRDSWILVKGSRGMRMERVVQGLVNAES
ncbi:MAG: UDP-N-acetylmuramoyl-tripeptide--D-alanyl-D-alanine ligase [Desulforhabdus sp.]|jgi:UDP-N-acetylmuramoyl-tripeptide--D-alanyl-D-alanine ligase|nr:UDP-N-acetylmuramoyl-tripeptide--D-alanyl-D-alanine ligase [Desulforhabdus sp.]